MVNRSEFLSGLIGTPWKANAEGPDAFDCWHACKHIHKHLFNRDLPSVVMPENPSWRWLLAAIEHHPERQQWKEVPRGPGGLVVAGDGALVLMARIDRPAHIGVWLKPEARIIHCDGVMGVCCETLSLLHMGGWRRLRFYEPVDQNVPLDCQLATK
jgi:hypothetical protein